MTDTEKLNMLLAALYCRVIPGLHSGQIGAAENALDDALTEIGEMPWRKGVSQVVAN